MKRSKFRLADCHGAPPLGLVEFEDVVYWSEVEKVVTWAKNMLPRHFLSVG
ncbi:hypothetical protein, partial [Xenorhabdus ehlersii]|uniref:hypothetical protein n=1 Tax=Xenorhabdus ehlersii TaxID=290111 RepID=UPI003BB7365F